MGSARAVCLRRIAKADRHRRFGIFHPVNEAEEPVYVHAKILVVDDRLLRVGSSNINNRSLGFDSECDLAVEAKGPGRDAHAAAIRALRNDLLGEHLGAASANVAAAVDERDSLLAAIEALARPRGRSLRPLPWEPANDMEEAVVVSRLADPERPKRIETRLTHLAKRAVLKIPPPVAIAGAGLLAGLALAKAARRRR
jgi:phospholipase D1/2